MNGHQSLHWILILLLGLGLGHAAAAATPQHALTLYGEAPKYRSGFTHFDYVNPAVPKGGTVRLAEIGSFDSLNPFILKGTAAAGIGRVYDTLTVQSLDEPFTEYGLLAESVVRDPDNRWVEFHLRPQARFHDGEPITAEDVAFTLELLKTQGHPFYRAYYKDVARAVVQDPRTVRFEFATADNRELPLIVGQMPVLPRHAWVGRDFTRTTLEPPLGSGPYRVAKVDPGRSITYRRVADYWAKDLPVNRGRYNFDTIRIDYYRDDTVALEAFKAGEYDFRQENVAKNWAVGYDGPALRDGRIRKEEIPHQRPTGMQGFVFNTRKSLFADRRVRWALAHAFDFEWANKNLFYGAYARTKSYFSNSELAARGLPSPAERKLLEPYRDRLPPEVFTQAYAPPRTDGSGRLRANLRTAARLLREAGWVVRDGRRVHRDTGEPFTFELLLVSPSFERVALPFQRNLRRLGIEMRVRTVDPAQYQKRLDQFDFDMVVASFGQSLSPGNEQRDYWTSAAAETPGSRNLAGIRDPVVDALVERLIHAPDRQTLVTTTRALDRVLLWGHYVIPHWHLRYFRVAYWDRLAHPRHNPPYGLDLDAWWHEQAGGARTAAGR